MKTLRTWVAAAALLALTGAAQSALVSRPGGMVYDSTLNITWLADWNQAGPMDWTTANDWANDLVYGGFDDWRLPTSLNADATGPCGGLDCSGSEMGHMFYNNWGATAGSDFSLGTNAANLALFSNVQSSIYWSGTEDALNPGRAWAFRLSSGQQAVAIKGFALSAVAVRPGDVAATVPEPQTLALALLALCVTVVVRRRRPAWVFGASEGFGR